MPIQVTCPNCLKRFQVSDKFGGKKGPCPNCKKQITVPDKSEEVTIHAPDDGAPKDRSGQSVLKPLVRKETEVTKKGLFVTIGVILAVFAVAVGFRFSGGDEGTPLWAQMLGLLVLAPPLVWSGYSFLYDQERAPYVGPELRNRVLICSVLFALIWIIYAFVPAYVFELDRASEMGFGTLGVTVCVMLLIGGFASTGCFELEFGNALIHAGLYFIAIILLAFISGVKLAGEPTKSDDRLRSIEEAQSNLTMSIEATKQRAEFSLAIDCPGNRISLSSWESRALARRGRIQVADISVFQHALPSPPATASDSPEGRVKSEKSSLEFNRFRGYCA